MEEGWATKLGSAFAGLMVMWAMVFQYFPHHFDHYFTSYFHKLVRLVYPYIQIRFPEQTGERLKRSEAYTAIELYLSTTCTAKAKKLKAEVGKDSKKLDLSMDDHEEVIDTFQGVKLWWTSRAITSNTPSFSYYPKSDEKRYYRLTFHCRHKELVHGAYLNHVMEEGKAAGVQKRQRKLYTNNPSTGYYEWKKTVWSHVPFEHPSTFDTIAMDPTKKQEIIQDLLTFATSKEYYKKIGKAWKRGYLLYGPPGTGKSSMVAAMANLLDYDVYDLELTAVKDNTSLRKLLIETTSKAIIVIEDIDCSLDLTGKRKKKAEKKDEKKDVPAPPSEDNEKSKVTLSGLLNFIDGLWSACGGERLIVFTTNHIEKLDPALIRRGLMDKHIELSYCGLEAFKVLANNYLGIKSHSMFNKIEELMGEVTITPADVAEHLMPKAQTGTEEEVTSCLENLIGALEEIKSKPVVVEVEEEDEKEVVATEKKEEKDEADVVPLEEKKDNKD